MIFGNWTALDKRLVGSLPKPGGREYTELEAMFSVSVDHDNKTPVSVSRYSRQWGWNRKTVKRHFDKWGIEIIYPESTSKKQNQMGQISIQIKDRQGTDQGQIRFIDNSDLMKERIRSRTDKGQIRDRSGTTTIYPDPKPDPKEEKESPLTDFDSFVKNCPERITSKWTREQIIDKSESIVDYEKNRTKGKPYKNFYSALRNYLKKDYPLGKNSEDDFSTEGYV